MLLDEGSLRTYAFPLKVPLIRDGEAHTGFIPGEAHTGFIPLILIL